MTIYDPTGQSLLPFASPRCTSCPFGTKGRCRGPTSTESFLQDGPHIVGCFDTAEQIRHYANLRNHLAWVDKPDRYPKVPKLPPFIPSIFEGLPQDTQLPSRILYAVSLSHILYDTGKLRFSDPGHLRKTFKLPPDARICLLCNGKDPLLEQFWKHSAQSRSWETIRALEFEFVTSTTCSVYDCRPRFDQIHNQDRNYASYEFLTAYGIPTVPFLFTFADEDYEAAGNWLEVHDEVTVIGALAQMYTLDYEFLQFRDRLRRLCDSLPRPVDILVVGTATLDRISHLFLEFENVSICTGKPAHKAVSGHSSSQGLLFERASDDQTRAELLLHNIYEYERLCRLMATGGKVVDRSAIEGSLVEMQSEDPYPTESDSAKR